MADSIDIAAGKTTQLVPGRQWAYWQVAGWIALIIALVALPATASGYVLFMATLVAINVIATVGLNITVGYAGLLSIGHSAFIGVGAYASALMAIHLGTPLLLNVMVGSAAAFLVGLVFGAPSLRIKGVFLAIATLAAQYSLYFVFQQWTPVTGGDRGLSVPQVDILGMGDKGFYLLVVAVAVVLCIASRNLFRTRIGRAFIAVRKCWASTSSAPSCWRSGWALLTLVLLAA